MKEKSKYRKKKPLRYTGLALLYLRSLLVSFSLSPFVLFCLKQANIIVLTFACLFSGFLRCCFGYIVHYARLRNALNIEKYPSQI